MFIDIILSVYVIKLIIKLVSINKKQIKLNTKFNFFYEIYNKILRMITIKWRSRKEIEEYLDKQEISEERKKYLRNRKKEKIIILQVLI